MLLFSGADFNYGDMDEEVWGDSEEEGEGGARSTLSEAEMEKLLLQNMSDNDSDLEVEGGREGGREGGDKKRGEKSRLAWYYRENRILES